MIRIGIRADGGENGLGHIMRCLALSEALQARGAAVHFLTRSTDVVMKWLRNRGNKVSTLDNVRTLDEDILFMRQWVRKQKMDVLIVDLYGLSPVQWQELQRTDSKLIAIDDGLTDGVSADLVINHNVYAPDEAGRYPVTSIKLLGLDYFLRSQHYQNVPPIHVKSKVETMVVSLGGNDVLNLTPKVLRALQSSSAAIHIQNIHVVIGPQFGNILEIEEAARPLAGCILHRQVMNLAPLFAQADLAITAGGVTAYEAISLGIPVITVLQAENQIKAANALAGKQAVYNMGMGTDLNETNLRRAIDQLCNDAILRQKMHMNGKGLIDGQGASRCAEEIIKLITN
jgi:UDP-2,4-diacetamido-2,4,6-trideoxy-beta-L-altropyranose hydrolase